MKRSAFATFLGFALFACALPAAADPSGQSSGNWETRATTLAAGGISLDQAVQMAQSRFNARVVRADTDNEGNRTIYRLRLLSADGRVFTVRVDAQTGQFL